MFQFKDALQSILQMFKVSNNLFKKKKKKEKKVERRRTEKLSDVLQGRAVQVLSFQHRWMFGTWVNCCVVLRFAIS